MAQFGAHPQGVFLFACTHQIGASIGSLATAVNDASWSLGSRLDEIATTTADHRYDAASEARESSKREEKVIEMLDNIQRKRLPSI